MKVLQPDDYRYTALFCEENIWWLANSLSAEGFNIESMNVLIFSNSSKSIVMKNQQVAVSGHWNQWDYHVVLQLNIERENLILDFDTHLPFPLLKNDYLQNSFPVQSRLEERYQCQIRSVPADDFVRHFYSDRSHMTGIIERSRFPVYPIIQPADGVKKVSLYDYLNFQLNLPGTRVFPV